LDKQKKKEIELYRHLVNEYGLRYRQDFSRLYHNHWNNNILSYLPVDFDGAVLDLGCGNGILMSELMRRFDKVYGLDLSLDMLSSLKNTYKINAPTINGDCDHLPFKKEFFGCVICRGVLHHLPNPLNTVKEVNRVLVSGGIFICSEPCNDSFLLRLPRKLFSKKSKNFNEHHRAFFYHELLDIFNQTGFEIEASKRFGFVAFPLCGMPDQLPLMKYMPFSKYIAKYLIYFDDLCSRIPIVNHENWGITLKMRKILS